MADSLPLVFVDTETTGLDPGRHEVYEVALVKTDDDGNTLGNPLSYWIEPQRMSQADPGALRIGRFYERLPKTGAEANERFSGGCVADPARRREAAVNIAALTEDCHMVGARPEFDTGFLNAYLRNNGMCPAWHHRLIDVESLAIGLIFGKDAGDDSNWGRPQSLSAICEALDIPRPDAHTAQADCDQMKTAYFKLMEMAEQRDLLWHNEND